MMQFEVKCNRVARPDGNKIHCRAPLPGKVVQQYKTTRPMLPHGHSQFLGEIQGYRNWSADCLQANQWVGQFYSILGSGGGRRGQGGGQKKRGGTLQAIHSLKEYL